MVLLPAGAAATAFRNHSNMVAFLGPVEGWLVTTGKAAGLTAAVLLLMQFALSARLKLLDRAFGMDRLLKLHRILAAAVVMLACLHPLCLYATGTYEIGPWRSSAWPVYLGVAVLVLLLAVVCTSLWRVFLELPYGTWLWIHRLVFVAVVAAAVHVLRIGSDLQPTPVRACAGAILAAYAGLFLWVKMVRPVILARRRFVVTAVVPLNYNVCRIEVSPQAGKGLSHLPGQFAFLKIRGKRLPAEEHPFTISSGPARDGKLQFTIKASGDFTKQIPNTAPGDAARVNGPYGRFSYLLKSGPAQPLVMIAGGVGVTPMLSMLAHLAVNEPDRAATLIWCNRNEEDIFARDQLDELRRRMTNLTVHHALSIQRDWSGQTGRLDRAKLDRMLPANRHQAQYFLCGPPGMMDSVKSCLLKLGAGRRRIHAERFGL